uniref:Prokaryotic-type class I peptide chain release factors domain-containing protein n=1 Tax=Arion vulgaris TaxID=1028688 RepID=A0A0B7A8Z8_9EUPU
MKNSEIQELVAVLNEESDQEMKKMIEKEIEKCNKALEELENELIAVLVGEDLANHSDVVLEVTAGVGGQEAMLFAAEILSMYRNYAYYKGWTITGLTDDTSDIGGTRKATIEINGQDVYKHLKFEAGVHRVQRIPKTEKAGRIHTSTISVSVLPQPKEVDIEICQEDLKIDTFRSSGPGGQSVNTTDSAVRITHIPTGTVAESRQERSQIKNKDIAMKRLKNSIYQAVIEEQETKRRAARKMQMGSRGRSEKIRTYNFQQDRITDHRLKENCSDLTTFMTGGEKLDDFINSLADLDKVHSLESMLDEYEAEIKRKKSGGR